MGRGRGNISKLELDKVLIKLYKKKWITITLNDYKYVTLWRALKRIYGDQYIIGKRSDKIYITRKPVN